MRLFELTRPDDRLDAEKYLLDAGYLKLGSGSFADIWHKEGSDQVLKLFDGSDHAYYDYIQLCLGHSNPHFPKFFSKPLKVNAKFYAIKTELLTKATITYSQTSFLDDYTNLRSMFKTDEKIKKVTGADLRKVLGSAVDLLEDPVFKEAIDMITDQLITKKGYMSDLHPSNFMNRGDTLVFTDPVS